MALVNLQTDLTSLTFGYDRPGGGSSNQPYIQTAIPEGTLVQSPDFLWRNGFLAPVAAAKDTSRLTQMFFDLKSPNGLLFTAKANLLSRISVKTQATIGAGYAGGTINQGVYTPTSTIAQALVGFTGTHLNLLGLDPSSPMAGVVQSGLFPGGGLVTYESAVKGSANRLVELYDSKIKIVPEDNVNLVGKNIILSYPGGPGSILGIGKTKINFAQYGRTGKNSIFYEENKEKWGGLFWNPKRLVPSIDNFNSESLAKIKENRHQIYKKSTITSFSPSYKPKDNKTIDGPSTSRINYVSPGQRGNIVNYTDGKTKWERGSWKSMGPVDRINASPIYRSSGVIQDTQFAKNDLVKFRIAAIDNSNPSLKDYMHFRAYIDAFSDSYNGSWDTLKYMGRGENFYKYGGFTRTINLGFTVAAQSKEELIPMYRKLNFLASNLAPSYSDKGYMAGSLVKLTLGGWCYELPGFISSMTLDVPQESPWEIGINTEGEGDPTVKELPMIVKVSGFSFTPIEEFRPAKQTFGYGKDIITTNEKGETLGVHNEVTSYNEQRYIALNNGFTENYNNTYLSGDNAGNPIPQP